MLLDVGTRLGPYEILTHLGAGGMGDVYRARDAKLNRDVALKILPGAFSTDPDRLARFRREARVLASVSHPNIGQIYGFEDSHLSHALVLELIEGPTLADRIAHGPIEPSEALPIAKQMADALEAAHEHGIVHRDLKPANVKVTEDGSVKVLDFGLAKAFETTASAVEALSSPTLTGHATQVGVILGTAAYMSPEQAKGRPVDRRADIWAFGAVLYEMLSGHRAFEGENVSDVLASVLRQDIDWTVLPASTPPPVRRLLARCLDRDLRRRLRDIGEARILLEDPDASGITTPDVLSTKGASPGGPRWRSAMPIVLSAILAGGLAATGVWYLKPGPPLAVTRFAFSLPDDQTFSGILGHMVAVSPDGGQIAYVANGGLHLRPMSEHNGTTIRGSDGHEAVSEPVFSPDGRWLAFHAVADQTLKKIPAAGGTAVTICPATFPVSMSWGPDGIVFTEARHAISQVSPDGGTPKVLVSLEEGQVPYGPQMLPDGQHVLFAVATSTAPNRWDAADIVVQSVASGIRKTVLQGGSDARYLPTGHIIYAVSSTVFAVPFDVRRLEVTGDPVPVLAGVMRATSRISGAASLGVADNGTLVHIPGPISTSSGQLEMAFTDRTGGIQRMGLPAGSYLGPRASPDGRRIAFGTDDGKEAVVWIYDASGTSAMRRLTFGGNNRFPTWTADSTRIVFQSDREGDLAIFWQQADGTGGAERLTRPEPGTAHAPESASPTDERILFTVTKGSELSLWSLALRDRTATPFGAVQSSTPTNAVFSPDGRWVAYATTEGGRTRIFVEPFPASGTKYQLPARAVNATQPLWSADGTELFYNPGPGELAVVRVTTHPTWSFGNPVLVPRPFLTGPPTARRAFDITPGGKFVGLIQAGQPELTPATGRQIEVVLNWFEELKQRAPATAK